MRNIINQVAKVVMSFTWEIVFLIRERNIDIFDINKWLIVHCQKRSINIGGSIPITINTLVKKMQKDGCLRYPIQHVKDRFAEAKYT